MNRIFKTLLIVASMWIALFVIPYTQAAFLVFPTTPLISGSAVKPNMMLLLDSSGSMSNIVPDTPYDPSNVGFDCLSGFALASGAVDVRIKSDGNVYFKHNSTDYDFGTLSGNGVTGKAQKCFANTNIYNARLLAEGSGDPKLPSSYLSASYTGHYLNWYFDILTGDFTDGIKKTGTSTRMQIAKNASIDLIDQLSDIRVGLAQYNGNDGAQILTNIGDLNITQSNTLKTEIGDISNGGMTPLGESLADMGRYFASGYPAGPDPMLVLHPDGTLPQSVAINGVFTHNLTYQTGITAPSDITQCWCQQNFVVAMTDGVPTDDSNVSAYLSTYDNGSGEILDDIALAIFDMDLRPDLKNGNEQVKNNVTTHIVGFADETVINSDLMLNTAANGGGSFIGAADSASLVSAFNSASQNIFAQVAAMTAVSFNTSELSADSSLYQAGFNTAGWRGSLKAFELSDSGVVATTASWDAGALLDGMASSDRNIFTYNGVNGIEFKLANFANFSAAQKADLYAGVDADGDGNTSNDDGDAQLLVNYIRGDDSNEGSSSEQYRVRSNRLGDIVNSTSVYVGKPLLHWPDYWVDDKFGTTGNNYSDFRVANESRTPMIYVGANDGMLHGFNAQLTGVNKGVEKFAYIPNSIASSANDAGLHYLADQMYGHRFYVDLTPTISDVYINSAWRTVLIGGLRAGGKGLFALDVTNPDDFQSSAANAAKLALWEFSSANDVDFGYSYSKPTVAMMANGKWAVIVGNGYNNSGDGHAKLFILYIEDGLDGWTVDDYVKIDCGVGDTTTPNGLSTPTVIDTDGDNVADRVYAGDLQGNMWAFDVSAANTNQWIVAYKDGEIPKPLFTARNNTGQIQPITSAPSVTKNPNAVTNNQNEPNLLVFFGTGKYLEASDVSDNLDVMSYYGVLDAEEGEKLRTDLSARELLSNNGLRAIKGSAIDWNTKFGWYVDLLDRASTGAAANELGERVIHDSLVRNKILFFNTITPSGDACSSGGESWLMSLRLDTGLAPSHGVFDANKDGIIDDLSDPATTENDLNDDGVVDDGDTGYVGERFDNGLASESGILGSTQYTVGSTGILKERKVVVGEGTQEGRLSWQELFR